MRGRAATLASLSVAALLDAPIAPAAAAPTGSMTQRYAAPESVARLNVTVQVVLQGLTIAPADQALIKDEVEKTFVPGVAIPNVTLAANIAPEIAFVEAGAAFGEAYAEALNLSFARQNSSAIVDDYEGLLRNVSRCFPAVVADPRVPLASAEEIEAFLARAPADFPELDAPPGQMRVFLLNPESVPVPYFYSFESEDPESSWIYGNDALGGWGGDGPLFFFDLRAAPAPTSEYAEGGRQLDYAGVPPVWSYGTGSAAASRLRTDVAEYLRALVHAVLMPSFFLPPVVPSSLDLSVTLVDATEKGDLFQPGSESWDSGPSPPPPFSRLRWSTTC